MRRDAPRVLFFHAGSICPDASYDMAYLIGSNIGFRNATAASNDGSLEPCVAVSGAEPEDVPLDYYKAYPYVTTAAQLVRAAKGTLTADNNPTREDDPEFGGNDDDEDEEEGMEQTQYELAPYVPDPNKSEEENAELKKVWDEKEAARVAALPAPETLAKDHPEYRAPSGPRRRRIKDPNTKRTTKEPNAPTPPPQPPGWSNNS